VRWKGGDKFKPLDGTSGELLKIKDLYEKQWGSDGLTTLEGMQASEEAVRQAISKHLYLHIATHGYFAPPELNFALSGASADEIGLESRSVSKEGSFEISAFHPGLLSGLALAGANNPKSDGNDGILSAEEVASLDLGGVDVAVLSACETGLGKVAGGEGLLGLQRAFQVAGARTVVSTLWKVDDGATRDLMERFYTNMWERDMGTLAALREAQLWILRERGPRGLDLKNDQRPQRLPPQYWAAFQLSGDWR
jgi:CHAT domain-containing protein